MNEFLAYWIVIRLIKDIPSNRLLWLTITLVESQSALLFGSADFYSCPESNVSHLYWSQGAISVSRITVWPIRWIGRCVSVRTVQRHLVAAGYLSRHSDICSRSTHNRRQRRRMLTHKHQAGSIRSGLIWHLPKCPWLAHRTVMVVPQWFITLFKG